WRHGLPFWIVAFVVALAVLCWTLRREWAVAAVIGATVFGVVYLKMTMYPSLDVLASARPLWEKLGPRRGQICVENIHRSWLYGLNYYAVAPLPSCEEMPQAPIRLTPGVGGRPEVAVPVQAQRNEGGQTW
ncbi:MAG TPA: hypothetical protein VE621_21530, partial [Bryobacteraceae bacterium]|nr:hypothetical protein [Bryobacteraceae bacterium]